MKRGRIVAVVLGLGLAGAGLVWLTPVGTALLGGSQGPVASPSGSGRREPPRAGPAGSGGVVEDPPPPPPPAAPDVIALLDGLQVGDKLGPCEVSELQGVKDGRARVVAKKDDTPVTLEIVRLGEKGPTPPATTEQYGVFYKISRGELSEQLPIAVIEGAAKALAKRLEKTERTVPPPAGMATSDDMPQQKGLAL
jgi:membrane-associated protease RseP (regulator of RpoE activity)